MAALETAAVDARGPNVEDDAGIVYDDSGVAYVEFLISFLPVFIMFLGMFQAALMYGANLAVSHAATRAVRSAVVVLDAPESEFEGTRMEIDYGGQTGSDNAMCIVLNFIGVPCSLGGGNGNARLNAIRSAASFPLISFAPTLEQVQDLSVYKAIGGDPVQDRAITGIIYNRAAVAVTFPDYSGTNFTVRTNENLKVRVSYLFHCGVPIAARFMCDDAISIMGGIPAAQYEDMISAASSGDPVRIRGANARLQHARERIARQRTAAQTDMIMAESPGFTILMGLATGSRFNILQAEASLPVHHADYEYDE